MGWYIGLPSGAIPDGKERFKMETTDEKRTTDRTPAKDNPAKDLPEISFEDAVREFVEYLLDIGVRI